MRKGILFFLMCTIAQMLMAYDHSDKIIHNGIPWFDEQGNIINAHGACIVEDGGRYWPSVNISQIQVMPFQVLDVTLLQTL